ncbi:MAG: hypothetical protein JW816_04540 [Candidatus Buchananbacteria bacterium]|nr:hypothetical protein [Candidatus Buchananbacteria bacterium]
MNKQLLALSTFSGTIIGVGLFGLPYITSKIGFWPIIIYFIFLGTVMIGINLMYGEITLRTKTNHRLPGYARLYLGRGAMTVEYFSSIIGLTGSLLAYIIIGGIFLTSLLSPIIGGNNFIYSTIFFIFGALIIYYGSGPVSKTEFFSLGLFFTILIIIFFKASPLINYTNFLTVDLNNFFLPYGVILFSIGGIAVVPEVKEILKGQPKKLKKILIIGILIPIITYLFFIFTIFGVTGQATTPDAMTGLNLAAGDGVVVLGFLFGIITTFTSFLTLGITLKKELNFDCKLPAWISWILACLPAYLLYLIGLNDFISIIGFIGSIGLGIDVIIISLTYWHAKKKSKLKPAYSLNLGKISLSFLLLLFLTGILFEVASLVR